MPNVFPRRPEFNKKIIEPLTKLELTLNEVDLLLDAISSHVVICEQWGEGYVEVEKLYDRIKDQVNEV